MNSKLVVSAAAHGVRIRLAASCLFLSGVCSAANAATSASAPQTPSRPMTPDSVALNVETFYRNFASPDDATREKAYLYLLGILDLTEGKSWCEYRQFKTVTLREVVGEYIQKLPRQRFNERAAVVIEEALKTKLPCGGKKR